MPANDGLYETFDGGSVDAAGVAFASDNGGTSVRVGGGLEAQFGPNTAIFANVDYETGLTDGTADTLGGTAGLRFNF